LAIKAQFMQTTIIESYLKAIDQATFQKMMNHLLFLEKYKFIGSPGSVVGKNKTSKGAPDSFFEDGDGFSFCEMTTKDSGYEKGFYQKLEDDIKHCFDFSATGIAPNLVKNVILCTNEEISAEQYNSLKTMVRSYNPSSNFETYTVQNIPYKLLYYPGLAEKYVPGLGTTAGALNTLQDFVALTGKGIQPSLLNPFVGRDEEIEQATALLEKYNVLILTGGQGVGKSKLAIELAEKYETDGFEARVIDNNPVAVWDDLQKYLLPNKKYLVVIDDANKSLLNLNYALQFFNGREDGTLKIIITIRDYVRSAIDNLLLDTKYVELKISPIKQDKLHDLIRSAVPKGYVINATGLQRVISIANGNPRLALMALQSFSKDNEDNELDSVFQIYDHYFKKLDSEISILSDKRKLSALGIISFFAVMDRNDKKLQEFLETNFQINWNELWETFIELEKNELVDLFGTDVVKISDQVLATYSFYKTFIDNSTASIDYSQWVLHCLSPYNRKISRSLTDCINTFGFYDLKEAITSYLIPIQDSITNDNASAYKFYTVFWMYREAETLSYIQNWVNSLPQESLGLEELVFKFKNNDHVYATEYFELLVPFWRSNTHYFRESLIIGINLIKKQPSRIPEVLKFLNDCISFNRFDYTTDYERQNIFLELVSVDESMTSEQEYIYDHLFLSIMSTLTGTEFNDIVGLGDGAMMMHRFHLVYTPAFFDLHQKMLLRLFLLHKKYNDEVLDILRQLIVHIDYFSMSEFAHEQQLLEDFIEKDLNSNIYSHCEFVLKYIEVLSENGLTSLSKFHNYLDSPLVKLAAIFEVDHFEKDELGNILTFDKQEKVREQRIASYIKGKNLSELAGILKTIEQMVDDGNSWEFDTSIMMLFRLLAEEDVTLYMQLLESVMVNQYKIPLNYGTIVSYPLKQKLVEIHPFYKLLNKHDYPQKQYWLQLFFEALDQTNVSDFYFNEFVVFIGKMKQWASFINFEDFTKFEECYQNYLGISSLDNSQYSNVIQYLSSILVKNRDIQTLHFERSFCQKCGKYYLTNLNLLVEIYNRLLASYSSYDHDNEELKAICQLLPDFFLQHLESKIATQTYMSPKMDNMKLGFVWDLENPDQLVDKGIELVLTKSPHFSDWEHAINIFFRSAKGDKKNDEKMLQYIEDYIKAHKDTPEDIALIFNVVVYRFNEQIIRFLKQFLILNNDVEAIKNIYVIRNQGYSGSRIPYIEREIKVYGSIIDMLSTLPEPLKYLRHKEHWERQIEYLKRQKQHEAKSDFKGWFE